MLGPNPHPKCLKKGCEVGVPLEWARTKVLASGVLIKLVRFASAIIPSAPSRFWYQRKVHDVPYSITGLNFQISDVSRPQSRSQCPFQQVLL